MRNPDPASPSLRPFNPAVTGYDPVQAWWLARLSALAYENKRRVVEELKATGFKSAAFVDSAGTQGFLAVHPGMKPHKGFGVLVFRGTENDWADILTDIAFLRTRLPDEPYTAHSGFVYAFKEVWGTSVEGLDTPAFPVKWYGSRGVSDALDAHCRDVPLFVTGHSLGAALATIATHYWPPRAMYTFGSPRVAGRELAGRFTQRRIPVYRFVNSRDVVTRVPFVFLGFRHVGELRYLTSRGNLLTGWKARLRYELGSLWALLVPLSLFPPLFLLSLVANAIFRLVGSRMFTDHRIAEYVRKLETLMP